MSIFKTIAMVLIVEATLVGLALSAGVYARCGYYRGYTDGLLDGASEGSNTTENETE